MMNNENLFPIEGGPIILSQFENEYGLESTSRSGHAYFIWATIIAVELGTGVSWVMCREDDVVGPAVSYLSYSFFLIELSSFIIYFKLNYLLRSLNFDVASSKDEVLKLKD
ncbi:hypothetical protein SLE2022_083360 [Rubroshorea leprosula]